MSSIERLTVFYDSFCPLCMAEMRQLKKRNDKQKLSFVDINDESFSKHYPRLDKAELNARIHGITDEGTVITGLDVTYHAWRLVGKGWLYAPLRWRFVKPLADWCYVKFAKHRYKISFLLTGKAQCDRCKQTL